LCSDLLGIEPHRSDNTNIKYASVIALGITLLVGFAACAEARGGGRHSETIGRSDRGTGSGGRRHGNDSYMKAASEERNKLLSTQLKSICRGC
jgi:hypothetical protein